jgi:surface antigen
MDLFSTGVLNAVVADLRVPQTGLLDKYFPGVTTEDTEEIHFDVDNKPRRIAPFVSPLVAGKVVRSRGFQTSTFKPAYVKDKRVFSPIRAIKRVMGERVGTAQYSPEQRMQILVAQDLADQLDMIRRRQEWMAAQALYAGAITVVGDDYPSNLVDFGRNAGHTVVKTGGNKWGDAGVNPLDDLQNWSDTMVKTAGVAIDDVVMTVDAWKVFRKNDEVKTRLDRYRGNSTMQQNAHKGEGLVFQGQVDTFNIYTYAGWYVDPATGTEAAMLPAGTVLGLAGSYIEGVQCFGAILDHDSLQAMEYFVKSWLENDPSQRYLLMQSSPLTVPYRINSTFRASVL